RSVCPAPLAAISRRRPSTYSAICTAVAPEAVRTRRTHATRPTVEHQLVPQTGRPRTHQRRSANYTVTDRDTVTKLRPYMAASPCSPGMDLLQPPLRDLIQRAPHRRRPRDRTKHACLMVQDEDVGDRLTAVGEHHCNLGQHTRPRSGVELKVRPTIALEISSVSPVR